jgi:hypothetical protein
MESGKKLACKGVGMPAQIHLCCLAKSAVINKKI